MFFKLRSTSLLAATLLALGIASGVQAQGKYVLISHAPDSDSWWNTIKNGLKQASEDHGVTVYYRNPAKSQRPKPRRCERPLPAIQKPRPAISSVPTFSHQGFVS